MDSRGFYSRVMLEFVHRTHLLPFYYAILPVLLHGHIGNHFILCCVAHNPQGRELMHLNKTVFEEKGTVSVCQ